MIIEVFKGGRGRQLEDRAIINQRPADGHIKPASFEDFNRITPRLIKEHNGGLPLKVGDILQIHTTLTFGVILGLGLAVIKPQENLKFKLVCSDNTVDLTQIYARRYKYDEATKKYLELDSHDVALTDLNEIGHEKLYIAGYVNPNAMVRLGNSVKIGLEVLSLPAEGLPYDFEIESRLHMAQSVRPPAYLNCC